MRQWRATWTEEYKEERRQAARAYRAANREKVASTQAEYRKTNRPVLRSKARVSYVTARGTPEGRSRSLLSAAQRRARKCSVPFSLDQMWTDARLRAGTCELTGLPFDFANKDAASAHAPSIDRIVPELGYTPENCRMVLTAVNLAKNRWSDAVLFTWVKVLAAKLHHNA